MHFRTTMRCHFSLSYGQRSKRLMTSNIVKKKPAYLFVADRTIRGINLRKTITFKTQNALDPTILLLGIYPTDTFPCAQNNMHEDTSYSTFCIVSNANWTQWSISRGPINKLHYIYMELYAAI